MLKVYLRLSAWITLICALQKHLTPYATPFSALAVNGHIRHTSVGLFFFWKKNEVKQEQKILAILLKKIMKLETQWNWPWNDLISTSLNLLDWNLFNVWWVVLGVTSAENAHSHCWSFWCFYLSLLFPPWSLIPLLYLNACWSCCLCWQHLWLITGISFFIPPFPLCSSLVTVMLG